MTVQECYTTLGADYDGVFNRLRKDERIVKFLLMFLKDPSYDQLKSAIEARNAENAFRAAHTIKGVGQNLSLTALYESASRLSDIFRNRTDFCDDALPEFETLTREYQKAVDCIQQLNAE
ncbi:MAG: Hpt domain-containing protein [Bacteroides sp.]|nr:Hpt domain-containing protein [Prevotella sp.]MCM1407451.1 Hpt domain-containing protein [Treponema brennaborense]MCM1469941.1 Hpt domain-containing protein [Bacteroides sp.]